MGSATSSNAEWIELYNDGSEAVSLENAEIFEAGGSTRIIKLVGSIPSMGWYVAARTTPSVTATSTVAHDIAGTFGGSGLSNSGEYLVLKDSSGTTLDSLDKSAGWGAGDSTTDETMQWFNGAWVTATGTPRAANVGPFVATTTTSTTTTSLADTTTDTATTHVGGGISYSAHEDPASLSDLDDKQDLFAVAAGRNRLGFSGTPLQFSSRSVLGKNDATGGTTFAWSFGDGTSASGGSVVHTYNFSGEYNVVVNAVSGSNRSVDRLLVKIEEPAFSMRRATSTAGEYVEIKNHTDREINIGRAKLRSGSTHFVFAPDTIMVKNGTLRLLLATLGLDATADIQFLWHDERVIASAPRFVETPAAIVVATPVMQVSTTTPAVAPSVHSPTVSAVVPQSRKTVVARVSTAVATVTPPASVVVIPKKESTLQRFVRWPGTALALVYRSLFGK